jgi:peptidoglycan hydrolase-like protein with peptidoglycan-binding domain
MQFGRASLLTTALILATTLPAMAMPRAHRGPTSHLFGRRAPKTVKPASQRGIAPERATQIQTALIKSGYMSGAPSGTWDNETQTAMQKFQNDNGWQTKLIPDSRAIIKLGLGPEATESHANDAIPAAMASNGAANWNQ